MIRINEIRLNNFGPYRKETLSLPPGDGVTLVFGENMRGKTTLLNAIRFALFGKVVTRGAQELALAKALNQVADSEGQRSFSVTLSLTQDGTEYTIVRECTVAAPASPKQETADRKVVQVVRVARGGTPLGQDETQRTLATLLPEQVSRFFLFDGELLQEYVELLRTESEQGARIAQAIERILGVPVLTGARDRCEFLLEQAREREAKAAQKNARTQQLGVQMLTIAEDISTFKSDVSTREADLVKMREKRAHWEEILRRAERVGGLLDERDRLRSDSATVRAAKDAAVDKLQGAAAEGWQLLLATFARKRATEVERELKPLDLALAKAQAMEQVREQQAAALAKGNCAFCGQAIGKGSLEHLHLPAPADIADLTARTTVLRARAAALHGLGAHGSVNTLLEAERDRDTQAAREVEVAAHLNEIEERLLNLDVESHRSAKREYDDTLKAMALQEEAVRLAREQLKRSEDDFKRLEGKLDADTSEVLVKERRRREVLHALTELFKTGVGLYREKLRAVVEKDASSIFIDLTTENEFTGLTINENYGLTIRHPGGPVLVRSAGAEHIVALALIAALQRNSPLRGPIFMDSPFGRLDEEHTSRVLKALPKLASQVVLLVYRNEVGVATARSELGHSLLRELELIRVSARETRIKGVAQ